MTKHQSLSCPGVTFEIEELDDQFLRRIDAVLAPYRQRVSELNWLYGRIDGCVGPDANTYCLMIAQSIEGVINAGIKPASLYEALASIDNLSIDGAPATVETLIDEGPAELVQEIYQVFQGAYLQASLQREFGAKFVG